MVSESVAVPNGNASGRFNLANDSVFFFFSRFDSYLGLKGDDIIKYVTWGNCCYLCSCRTVQFTYYSFGVVMAFSDSYAFLLL